MGKIDFGLKIKKPFFKSNYKYGDADFDGTLNYKDCQPRNPAQDGLFGRIKSIISNKQPKASEKIKRQIEQERLSQIKKPEKKRLYELKLQEQTVKRQERAASELHERRAGLGRRILKLPYKAVAPARRLITGQQASSSQGQKYSHPGRPSGVYIHTSPITGKPIPALDYYAQIKTLRRRARDQAATTSQRSILQQQQMLARRGIPPQVAGRIIAQRQVMETAPTQTITQQPIVQPQAFQRQIQPMFQQQMRTYPQMPQNYPEVQETPQQQQFRVVEDLMVPGRKILKTMPPRERWTMD